MKRYRWFWVLIVLLVSTGCGVAGAPMAYEEAAIAPQSDGMAPGEGESWRGAADTVTLADATVEQLIIRIATLSLIVPDTEQAIDQLQALADELDGYVVSLNTYQYQQGLQGEVTLRVPAESFDPALQRIEELATTVRSETVSGQDVTEEYVDLQSLLRHLQAKEAQLLEFLDQAQDTEAVLAVYEQLSITQQEIEQVSGRIEYLENQAALATITVELTPDALAQPLETGGWNLPGTLRSAVETLLDVLEFIVKTAIYLIIVGLPVLILLATPIFLLLLLLRWLSRLRRRRHSA